ncbi:hypothetical protein AcV5_004697 [Taiwanofungus camphoratus]|nr:hypothetical protein AcV5_004697 [Antrodia cinnamomea]
MSSVCSRPWCSLPTEMKLSVVDLLDFSDVKSLALVNYGTYVLCVPSMFRLIDIESYEALHSYLSCVPVSYYQYIRQLHISTKVSDNQVVGATLNSCPPVTDAVIKLLSHCSQVEQLTLNLTGSLSHAVISCFGKLRCLTSLCINHCGDEERTPLSERLVVSIAASVPNLSQLSLDRITRSAVHAPELMGARPFVPLVIGDEDIPNHPLLGFELRLPSLLRLPTLKKLRIRDTHLGDPHWSLTPVHCSLEVLDLGSCYHESPEFNRICTERIMGNVGHTVDEFALHTALTGQTFKYATHKETPLKRLRKIHLTPLFPVENVVDTLTTLSDSPIEQLTVQCHEDDVVDMCSALEDFLSLRTERGEQAFYKHLTGITIKTVSDLAEGLSRSGPFGADTMSSSGIVLAEHADAVKRLQEFLRDLRLADADALSDTCPPNVTGSDLATEKSMAALSSAVMDGTTA